MGPAADLAALGIDVVADRPEVGRNLQDHPGAGLEFSLDPTWAFERELRFDRAARSFPGWLALGRGMMGAPPQVISANIASRPPSREVDLYFLLIPLSMETRVWFPGVRRRSGPALGATWSLNYPRSHGSIRLRDSDAQNHPSIQYDLLSDPQDRADMIYGYRILRQLVARQPLAEVLGSMTRPSPEPNTDQEALAHVRATAGTAYHPSGTCRMGGGEDSVVAGALRVRRVERLRVVDASIFPRLPGRNTNLPVMMVAEKAADLIRIK